jgi:Tol biopolymer transport system component
MTPARWRQIEELYHLARERGPDALAQADPELRREVELLLAQDASSGKILDQPAADLLSDSAPTVVTVGSQIGPYRIEGVLGAGGMGQVFRAHDSKLNRPVAVKFLADELADASARRRFQREARMASSLNHPHILTVHDAGEFEGRQYLVTEFVDGGTLKDWANAEKRTWRQIVELLVGVADGLAAAHAAGITHRDIKPGNILVAKNGYAKLADFGLAKLAERITPEAPTRTLTEGGTQPGVIVGTVAYMSPEQASGRPTDARSDIFSFGVVLYEMLAGKRPFTGAIDLEVLQTILHRTPEPLGEEFPGGLRLAVEKALEKDPAERYQSMRELVVDLRRLTRHSGEAATLTPPDRGRGWKRRALVQAQPPLIRTWSHRRGVWAAVLAVLLVAGFLAWRAWRGPEGAPSTEPLRALPLTTLPGVHRYPSFSPDGNHVAFTWAGPKQNTAHIYVQQIGAGSPLRLTTGPNDDYSPVWSPDGRWIAFLRRQPEGGKSELRLIPPLGGPEHKLAEVRPQLPLIPVSLAWCPDSQCMVVTDTTGDEKPDALFVISLETGEKSQLTHPPPGAADSSPAVSPDGSWLVFRRNIAPYNGELYRLPLGRDRASGASAAPAGLAAAGELRKLTTTMGNADHPAWMPDGREILFSAKGSLWRLVVAGEKRESTPARLPFVGEDGIMPVASRPQPGRSPRLVYVRSFADLNIWRVETSAAGARASSPPVVSIASTRREFMPEFSPDGRRVAFISDRSGEAEIWLADPDGSNAIQLTFVGANTGCPRWSPNGELIAFHSNPAGQGQAYVIPSAGGKPRNVTSPPSNGRFPSFSRDGQWIYFTSQGAGGLHIWKVPTIGGSAVEVSKNDGSVALESSDGGYIYYAETIDRPSALWRLAVSGGVPVKVLEGVILGNFAVLDRGIYYIDQPSGETRLQYFDMAAGRSTTVAGNLGNMILTSLTASADGRAILFARVDSSVDDLMLVENFR